MTSTKHSVRRGLQMLFSIVVLLQLAIAQAGSVEDQVEQVQELESRLGTMFEELDSLEQGYRSELAEVERLKSQQRGWADDLNLQNTLRGVRRMANELTSLASTLRLAQVELRTAELETVTRCDAQITELELQLVHASSAQEQLLLIERLERYQQLRESYRSRSALVSANIELPDFSSLQLDDPDELRAALAELHDQEAEIGRQLGELETRIDSLERRRRLVAHAEDRADELRVFNEDSRSTKLTATRPSEQLAPSSTNPSSQRPPSELPNFDEGKQGDDHFGAAPEAEADSNAGYFPSEGVRDAAPGGSEAISRPIELPTQNYEAPVTIERREADVAVLVVSRREAIGSAAADELEALRRQRESLATALGRIDERGRELRERLEALGVAEAH